MPRGIPNPKPEEVNPVIVAAAVEQIDKSKLIAMKLERHYVPKGKFEIVGYTKPEVKKKTATGDWKVVEAEEFIEGEACPPPFHGVGYPNKIWASTVIRVAEAEAREMQRLGIAARDFD